MANDKKIPAFNAADIERYHKGLLSNAERHALEKAALDDPFLADALEGYAVPGTDVQADIIALKQRLSSRMEEETAAKVIPMGSGSQSRFPWLRAAVAILVIGGAGLLANQFFFTKKSGDIAQANNKAPLPGTVNDSAAPVAGNSTTSAEEKVTDTNIQVTTGSTAISITEKEKTSTDKITSNGVTEPTADVKINTESAGNNRRDVTLNNTPTPVTTGSGKAEEVKKPMVPNAGAESKEIAKVSDDKTPAAPPGANIASSKSRAITDADGIKDQAEREKTAALSRKTDEQRFRSQQNNIFRGRVTDASNAGVPFANVTNVEDKAGTYTDVNGYFNLTSPDSVLNVQIRSIGFENNQVQLKNTVAATKVVLHEDRSLSEVVISNQKPNVAARNRDANRTLQEPEPADGWDNYDAYLTNNLDIPEDIKTKQASSGSVQVSFEVDKYGEPVNIRVEKSLCDKCDKEAIRLIKEGPKWKRNAASKGRTTVTINF